MNTIMKLKETQEIERVREQMSKLDPETKEYQNLLGVVERLEKIKAAKDLKQIVIPVVANIIGILLVIKHEDVQVITSKAFQLIWRK